MRGLIIKDFLYLKNLWKNMLLIFIGTFFLCLFMNNYFLFISLMPVMLITTGINTFQADEFFNTEIYAMTYPISRKQIVWCRYLFTLITFVLAILIGIVLYGIIKLLVPTGISGDELGAFLLISFLGLIFDFLFYPIIYKYGCEKSSFVVVSIIIILLVVISFVQVVLNITIDVLPILEFLTTYGFLLVVMLALVTFILSFGISARIYQKQDF